MQCTQLKVVRMNKREQELETHHWAFRQVTEEYKVAIANDADIFVLMEIQVRLNAIREQYMECLLNNMIRAS